MKTVNWEAIEEAKNSVRTVGYCRVSTVDQTKGVSLSYQEDKINKYIEYSEQQNEGIYVEKGVSGAKESREELGRLLEDAKEGKFDMVVVWKADRFSRDLSVAVEIYKELEKYGVTLFILDGNIDTSTPMGKMVFYQLSIFAEMERDSIKERLEMGKIDRVRKGNYIGKKPYGYDVEGGKLHINEDEAKVVEMIFKWSAYNDYTLRKIASELNNLGILPPSTRSSQWSFNSVSSILKNELYYGEYIYKGEKINLDYQEIVSKSIFMRANKSKRKGE